MILYFQSIRKIQISFVCAVSAETMCDKVGMLQTRSAVNHQGPKQGLLHSFQYHLSDWLSTRLQRAQRQRWSDMPPLWVRLPEKMPIENHRLDLRCSKSERMRSYRR
jgi:hypothetical protein